MNTDWAPVDTDSLRSSAFYVYRTATPAEVLFGATPDIELTRYVQQASQTNFECSLQLAWHDELYGTNQPSPGQILEVKLSGQQLFVGIIHSISDFSLSSGSKRMTIIVRSRDALPLWRETRRITDIFPVATPVGFICRQIAKTLGLTNTEIEIPDGVVYTVHSNTQLADLTPWQMLTALLQSSGAEPYVDARGRLKTISRDIQRLPDITFEDNRRIVSIHGSKSRSQITEVRVKWLDPKLSEVKQQSQVLANATVTAGFFQLKQTKDIEFSNDGRQRARDTYLVTKQSANSGLLPVCDEDYEQLSPTKGVLTLRTTAWVPALATGAMAAKFITHQAPDTVAVSPGGGVFPVTPVGRKAQYAADAVLFLTLMSIGTGVYEIWGTPFDYVHARNTTVAYNSNAQPWELNAQELESDFLMNEEQAQAMAIRELLYTTSSASQWKLTIVDDPRIENGDILELSSGMSIYVTSYSRDLSNGSPALLDIQGFAVRATGPAVGVPNEVSLPASPRAVLIVEPVLLGVESYFVLVAPTGGARYSTVTATVQNQGTESGTWAIETNIGGIIITPSSGVLAPGATQTVSILCSLTGAYTLTLQNLSAGQTYGSPSEFVVAALAPAPGPGSGPAPIQETTAYFDPMSAGYTVYRTWGPWTILPCMPMARAGMAVFTVGSRILFAAGNHIMLGQREMDGHAMWLDPATGTWELAPDEGVPGQGNGTIIIGGGRFQTGGDVHKWNDKYYIVANPGGKSEIWKYDPASTFYPPPTHWQYPTESPNLYPEWGMGTMQNALVGDEIYFPIGGRKINLATGVISDMASLPDVMGLPYFTCATMHAIGGKIYMFGCHDANPYISTADRTASTKKTYVYDPLLDSFTQKADPLDNATSNFSTVLGSNVHLVSAVYSDADGTIKIDGHYAYNYATDTWSIKAKLPPIIYALRGIEQSAWIVLRDDYAFANRKLGPGAAITTYGGKMYIAGGGQLSGGGILVGYSANYEILAQSMAYCYDPALDV